MILASHHYKNCLYYIGVKITSVVMFSPIICVNSYCPMNILFLQLKQVKEWIEFYKCNSIHIFFPTTGSSTIPLLQSRDEGTLHLHPDFVFYTVCTKLDIV